MPEILDPEPSDRRTSEWKAWFARQNAMTGVVSPSPSAAAGVMPEPNVFFSCFLAACQAYGVDAGQEDRAKQAWHAHRKLISWVNSGQDTRDYDAICVHEAMVAKRKADIERRDAEAEAAKLALSRAEFGAKSPLAV